MPGGDGLLGSRGGVVVSVDSLLDGHEVVVRADELREETARVAAALGEAELALEHVIITKVTLAAAVAGHSVTFEARQGPETVAPGAVRVEASAAGAARLCGECSTGAFRIAAGPGRNRLTARARGAVSQPALVRIEKPGVPFASPT